MCVCLNSHPMRLHAHTNVQTCTLTCIFCMHPCVKACQVVGAFKHVLNRWEICTTKASTHLILYMSTLTRSLSVSLSPPPPPSLSIDNTNNKQSHTSTQTHVYCRNLRMSFHTLFKAPPTHNFNLSLSPYLSSPFLSKTLMTPTN